MSEHIQLTEQWGLRKLQLADRSEWALQYLGMDWIRMCEFLPSKNDTTSMDDDIRKFAEAVKSENERLQERVADLQYQWGYTESIQTLKIERLTAALESIIVDPPATLDEPDRDAEVIFKMRAIAAAALTASEVGIPTAKDSLGNADSIAPSNDDGTKTQSQPETNPSPTEDQGEDVLGIRKGEE